MNKNYFTLIFLIYLFIFSNSYAQTTAIPDPNFEQALIDLGIDSDGTVNGSVATSDISGVTELDLFDRSISDLTGIQDFISLISLDLEDNQLTSLDLSNNTALVSLDCVDNKITGLDLSNNTALTSLNCIDNKLTSLNIRNGNNSIITFFNAINNGTLTCIQVDDETNANNGIAPYDNWDKDGTTTYAEDCQYVLSINDEILDQTLNLYPNPVSEILSIESKLPLQGIEIYNLLGQEVKQVHSNFETINLKDLSRGIYLIKISSENGSTVRKLIKN